MKPKSLALCYILLMEHSGFAEMRENAYHEAVDLFAEIAEKGGGMDPAKLAGLRAQLQHNLKALGATRQDGSLHTVAWSDFVCQMAQRKDTPIKPENYPAEEVFAEAYARVVTDKEQLQDDIQPRGNTTPEDYLYGLGMVMATREVYESVFENDPIVIRNGKAENGRHRDLAREVLQSSGYVENWPWVKTEYED